MVQRCIVNIAVGRKLSVAPFSGGGLDISAPSGDSSSSSSSSSLLWSPSEGVRYRGTGPQKFIFWEFSCNPVTNNFLFMLLVLLPPVYSSGKFVIRGGPVPWYQTSSSLLMRVRYHGTGPPFMSLPWGIKWWEKDQNHFQNINRHSADKKRREIHFF